MFLLPPSVTGNRELVLTKCPTEKSVTEQEFVVLEVTTTEPVEPLELLKLNKRLVICTSCGTIRLIN